MKAGALGRLACVCSLVFMANAGPAVADDTSACATVRGIDPRTVAFVFDIDGGQMPRGPDGPLLSVSADGVATVRAARIGEHAHRVQLTAQAHCAHVRALLDDFDMLGVDGQAIRRAIAAAPPHRRVADAATTSLTITWAGTRHAISIHALRLTARQNPAIAPLQRFEQAAQYLTGLAARLRAQAVAPGEAREPGRDEPPQH
jgi:hypothetical protein